MKILGWSFQITLQGPCLDETMTRQKPLYIYIGSDLCGLSKHACSREYHVRT